MLKVTQIRTNEYRVEYEGKEWYVNYCNQTDSCPGSTPEEYHNTHVEERLTDKVRDLVIDNHIL